jgi:hypothetical protein
MSSSLAYYVLVTNLYLITSEALPETKCSLFQLQNENALRHICVDFLWITLNLLHCSVVHDTIVDLLNPLKSALCLTFESFRVQALYVVDICIFPIKIRGSGSLARGNVCNLIYFRQSTGSNSSPFPRIRSEGSSLWFSSVLGKCWIILWIMDAEFKDFRGCSCLH